MPRGHEGPVATQADAPLPPTWQSDKWGRIRELRKKRKQTNQIGKQEIEKGGCRLSGRKALERPGTTIAVRSAVRAAMRQQLGRSLLSLSPYLSLLHGLLLSQIRFHSQRHLFARDVTTSAPSRPFFGLVLFCFVL